MNAAREALIKMIADESNNPITILGGVVSFLRVSATSVVERSIADEVDEAVKAKIEEAKAWVRAGRSKQ